MMDLLPISLLIADRILFSACSLRTSSKISSVIDKNEISHGRSLKNFFVFN